MKDFTVRLKTSAVVEAEMVVEAWSKEKAEQLALEKHQEADWKLAVVNASDMEASAVEEERWTKCPRCHGLHGPKGYCG